MLEGFAAGAGVSALAASGLLLMVMRADDQKRILGEVVSAHLRSLQAQHLIDVLRATSTRSSRGSTAGSTSPRRWST